MNVGTVKHIYFALESQLVNYSGVNEIMNYSGIALPSGMYVVIVTRIRRSKEVASSLLFCSRQQ